MQTGLKVLAIAKESELTMAYARNPHELGRTMEALAQANVGEVIIHACLARKVSNPRLGLQRMDYQQVDSPENEAYMTIKLENGKVKTRDLSFNYWLQPPYKPTLAENYDEHSEL